MSSEEIFTKDYTSIKPLISAKYRQNESGIMNKYKKCIVIDILHAEKTTQKRRNGTKIPSRNVNNVHRRRPFKHPFFCCYNLYTFSFSMTTKEKREGGEKGWHGQYGEKINIFHRSAKTAMGERPKTSRFLWRTKLRHEIDYCGWTQQNIPSICL